MDAPLQLRLAPDLQAAKLPTGATAAPGLLRLAPDLQAAKLLDSILTRAEQLRLAPDLQAAKLRHPGSMGKGVVAVGPRSPSG